MFTVCASERILKIGQYLAKIWTSTNGTFFGMGIDGQCLFVLCYGHKYTLLLDRHCLFFSPPGSDSLRSGLKF